MSSYLITGKVFTDVSCSKSRRIQSDTVEIKGVSLGNTQLRKLTEILLPEVDQVTISKDGRVNYIGPISEIDRPRPFLC